MNISRYEDQKVVKARLSAWAGYDLMQVIHAYCVSCVGGRVTDIRDCQDNTCVLWPFRAGRGKKAGFEVALELLRAAGRPEIAARAAERRSSKARAWVRRKKALRDRESAEASATTEKTAGYRSAGEDVGGDSAGALTPQTRAEEQDLQSIENNQEEH